MRVVYIFCTMLFIVTPARASEWKITLYLDGAIFMQEITVAGNVAEISLPPAMQPGSLRIKPLGGSSIEQVEVVPVKPDRKIEKEKANLLKRRYALQDRLQALDAKETVFKSAAKSQSGKSPRRTKTNPDPMKAVREGTEFAISELEGVYRTRRITEAELKTVETGLSAIDSEGRGRIAKVRMCEKGTRLRVSFLRTDLKWVPSYDFRLNKPGELDVVMHVQLPQIGKGTVTGVVPAAMSDAADEALLSVPREGFPQLAVFTFPFEQGKFSSVPTSSISFSFKNLSVRKLPPGEATCYLRGEYLGKTMFDGSLPGVSTMLSFGR